MAIYNRNSTLIIKRLSLGQMNTNCYLVSDRQTKETLIIDPGDEAEYVENYIMDNSLLPKLIVSTHGHFDHNQAVLTLTLVYKIPFFINQKDEFILVKIRESAMHFLGTDPGPAPKPNGYVNNWDMIKIGKTKLQIIETPGHTPGGICIYSKENNLVFSGDTIFAEGHIGRTDLSYSSQEDLKLSLQKILCLPVNTVIYPGHGYDSTIGLEKECHQKSIDLSY